MLFLTAEQGGQIWERNKHTAFQKKPKTSHLAQDKIWMTHGIKNVVIQYTRQHFKLFRCGVRHL